MACNCMEEKRQILLANTKSSYIFYENTCNSVDEPDNKKVALWFKYERTMPKGGKKESKSFISGNYCTFCGTKY